MRDLTNEVLEQIRRTLSGLPKDVEDKLRGSVEEEELGSAPICLDCRLHKKRSALRSGWKSRLEGVWSKRNSCRA